MKISPERISTLMAMILNSNVGIRPNEARKMSYIRTKKRSYNVPHYGNRAAARNLRHAKSGTHGLRIVNEHIVA